MWYVCILFLKGCRVCACVHIGTVTLAPIAQKASIASFCPISVAIWIIFSFLQQMYTYFIYLWSGLSTTTGSGSLCIGPILKVHTETCAFKQIPGHQIWGGGVMRGEGTMTLISLGNRTYLHLHTPVFPLWSVHLHEFKLLQENMS